MSQTRRIATILAADVARYGFCRYAAGGGLVPGGTAMARNDGLPITPKVPVFGFQHSASANKDWVDPIVGLTGRYRIDDK